MKLGDFDITQATPNWAKSLDELENLSTRVLTRALSFCKTDTEGRACELSLLLTNDEEVRTLNRDYRGQDKATNVLSFPSLESPAPGEILPEPGPLHLGDLAMAYGVVAQEALDLNIPFRDHYIHLLIHGALHLIGFDHIEEDEAEEMESLEIAILKELNIANPYEER